MTLALIHDADDTCNDLTHCTTMPVLDVRFEDPCGEAKVKQIGTLMFSFGLGEEALESLKKFKVICLGCSFSSSSSS